MNPFKNNFIKKKLRIWGVVLGILFISFIFTGCGTTKHTIICTSSPSGAKVTINNQECETPCKMKVPWGSDAKNAKYELPDGRTKKIKLPEIPSEAALGSKYGSYACYIIAVPLLAVPLTILILDNNSDDKESVRTSDSSFNLGLVGAIAAGVTFLYIGKTLEVKPTSVHAIFPIKYNSKTDEEEKKKQFDTDFNKDEILFPKELFD